MTAEVVHEGDSRTPPPANDNARAPCTGIALVGALQWRHPDAMLELAAALGEIAADLWLAGKGPLTVTRNANIDPATQIDAGSETITRGCT